MISVNEIALMLVHYALLPDFQRIAKTKIIEKHWDPVRELPMLVLWKAITSVAQSGQFKQTVAHIRAALHNLPEGAAVENSQAAFFYGFYSWINSYSEANLNISYAKSLLQKFLNERHVEQLIRGYNGTDNIDEFFGKLSGRYRDVQVEGSAPIKPLAPDQPRLTANFERLPIGIKWFDAFLNGGPGKADSILFLAPSGGGKTVFGMQAAIKRCELHKYVDVFLYEQPPSGDIAVRMYSLISEAHRREIEGRDFDQLPADIRNKINAWSAEYGKYLRLHDFSSSEQGSRGVEDMKILLEQARQEGEASSLIITDWVSSACRKFMAMKTSKSKSGKDDVYSEIVNFSREHRELLVDMQCQGIMLQQIAPAMVKTVGAEVHYSDAMDCKSIGLFSAWCVGIGRLEQPTNAGLLWLSKARQGQPGHISVTLNGGYCRFDESKKVHDKTSGMFIDSVPGQSA